MKRIRRSTWLRSFLLPLATTIWIGLSACTSWKSVKEPVPATLDADRPDDVRIQLVDGTEVKLRSPRIVSDSLEGLVRDGKYRDDVTRVRYALSDITTLATKQADGWKTVGLVAGITLGALLVVGIAAAASDWDDWDWGSGSGSSSGSSGTDTQFSCPLIYSWDGESWRLDSGTFGGAIFEPLERTDIDGLDHVAAIDHTVRLRLANELNETDHIDGVELWAVDHAPGTEVVPDGSGTLHLAGGLSAPITAVDDHGRDVLATLRDVDGWGWESSPTGRDTARVDDVRSFVELAFHRPPGAQEATLVVHGNNTPWASWLMNEWITGHGSETDAWYASLNADAPTAQALGEALAREAFLSVSTGGANGWTLQGLVWEAGPEIAKRQAHRLRFPDDGEPVARVRLESVPLYWNLDQVAISWSIGESAEPVTTRLLPASATFERDGRDVRAALAAIDGDRLSLETGESVELRFDVPPVPEGLERSYLAATTGWYRIHGTPREGAPLPELARVGTEPLAVSRLSVSRLNDAVRTWNERKPRNELPDGRHGEDR
jgi:hypothetical protein